MTTKPDRQLTRAIRRYGFARATKAFEGSIPVFSHDPEEQRDLDEAHAAIQHELERSERLLRGIIQRRIDAAVSAALEQAKPPQYDRWEASVPSADPTYWFTEVFSIPCGASETAARDLIVLRWDKARRGDKLQWRNPDLRVRKLADPKPQPSDFPADAEK